jgi:hypothetical protein
MILTNDTIINGRITLKALVDQCSSYDLKQGHVFTDTSLWLNSIAFWSVVEESMYETNSNYRDNIALRENARN